MVCSKCGECCKFVVFTIPKSNEKELPKDYVKYYEYHNIEIIKTEEQIIFKVWNKCKHLTEENKCAIWGDRPEICRNSKDWAKQGKASIPAGCTDT